MKKASFVLLFFSFYFGISQNNHTIKLVELLHGEKIDQTTENVKNFISDTIKVSTQVKELKIILSKIYKDYSKEEIESLITFYESAPGKKLLKSQVLINSKILDKIYEWEARIQGIELEEDSQELVEIESEEIIDIKKEITLKKELPVVNTLDDLKKLIKKDPNTINDSMFLAELLGVEKIVNPASLVVEENIETGVKSKKLIQNHN